MALTEWEREEQRRAADDRDRENNRLLRQQTESLRRSERAQLADMEHAAAVREQELEVQQEAAAAAWRAAELEQDRLDAQREHNAAVSQHNFTMWRQGTDNGERYEAWLDDVAPLLKATRRRDERWEQAKAADIAAQREEQVAAALGALDRKKYRLVHKGYGPGSPAPVFKAFVRRALLAFVALTLASWALLYLAYVTGPLAFINGPTSNMLLLYVVIADLVAALSFECGWRYPLARKYSRLSNETLRRAYSDLQTGFIDTLPESWTAPGDEDIKEQLADAEDLVEWMPTGYHEFRLPMLTVVPTRIPAALHPDAIDPRAVNLRTLAQELSGDMEPAHGGAV